MVLILSIILAIALVAATIIGVRLIVLLNRFTPRSMPTLTHELDALPTVSVCIPARNETHAMTQCLERVIASSYPKLEIIVLDDSSVDNTSILIKSFAHAGVRFVEGSPLPEYWLGKTHSEHSLYKEASGDYLLYLDVDTHLSPRSIDNIVATALVEEASMVSVLPTRDDAWRGSVLFATLRHFWSIITHRKKHPAVTSNMWLVKKDVLTEAFGGFEHLRMAVAPESIVASYAAIHQRYRFFISTPSMGVSYEKKWKSQCETSIRLLFPFFGGRVIFALAGLCMLGLFLVPFAVVTCSVVFSVWSAVIAFAFGVCCVLLAIYMTYTGRVWKSGWFVGGILFPFILIQESLLLIRSMYAYMTRRVTWKGRPITQSARQSAEGR